jgi:hypothetical protein
MKPKHFLILFAAFLLHAAVVYGQEKKDSVRTDTIQKQEINTSPTNDNNIRIDYFLSPETPLEQRISAYIFNRDDIAFNLRFQDLMYGTFNLGFEFTTENFHLWYLNNPFQGGFDFHYNQFLGIQNLSMYTSAEGMLYYRNNMEDGVLISQNRRGVAWQAGYGLQYQIRPKSVLFWQLNFIFNNLSQPGSTKRVGVKMEF